MMVFNLYWGLSQTCNLRCTYCYVPEYNKNQKKKVNSLAIEDTKLLISRFKEEKAVMNRVILHGAETFVLEPETINSVVKLLRPHTAMKVAVQTNGVLLTANYHDRMGDLTDDFIIGFSIDVKTLHNKYRENTYDKVLENLKLAYDLGYKVRVLSVVGGETINYLNELEELFKYLDELGIYHSIKYLHGIQEMMINDYESIIKWGDWLYKTGYYKNVQNFSNKFCINGKCTSSKLSEFNADGSVVVCNKTNNTEGVFANWRTDSFKDIAEKRLHAFDDKPANEDCKVCRYYLMCMGGCPVDRDINNYAIDCVIKKYVYGLMEADSVDIVELFNRPYNINQNNRTRQI